VLRGAWRYPSSSGRAPSDAISSSEISRTSHRGWLWRRHDAAQARTIGGAAAHPCAQKIQTIRTA
tara:strand:+ start:1226 stop:1420 length:195 start_codon:yes stop_codon:yes gene_type:complete